MALRLHAGLYIRGYEHACATFAYETVGSFGAKDKVLCRLMVPLGMLLLAVAAEPPPLGQLTASTGLRHILSDTPSFLRLRPSVDDFFSADMDAQITTIDSSNKCAYKSTH